MTLAMVQAAVALVVALIITWSGLMVAVALFFPARTRRAERAISEAPVRRLGIGLLGLLAISLSVVMFQAPNGLAKLMALVVAAYMTIALTVGAAGLSRLLGSRIADASGARSEFGALVRGSLLFSLAGFFPGIGWYLFTPVAAVLSLGGGIGALWPEKRPVVSPPAAQIADAGAA